jgi:tape measure domain-containing protein
MAIQTLGIRMLVQGAERMARDLSHVTLSLFAYSKAVSGAEKGMARLAQGNAKRAEAVFERSKKTVDRLTESLKKQQVIQNALNSQLSALPKVNPAGTENVILKLEKSITRAENKVNKLKIALDKAWSHSGKVAIQEKIDKLEKHIGVLKDKVDVANTSLKKENDIFNQTSVLADKLNTSYSRTAQLQAELTNATNAQSEAAMTLAEKQEALKQILDGSQGIVGTLSKFFGVLTGKFGEGVKGATNLDTALLKTGLSLSSAALAMNVITIALDAVALVAKVAVGAIKLVWDIFAKLASMAYNAAKAIASFVINGLKKLVAIPFNIVVGGLRGIWESIKRIGEIAIGMNISNLIWNLGTKIKNLGEMAFNASGDFQKLQVRLRGLINRELSKDGTSLANGFAEASRRASELSDWISKLAVKSIFDAKTIANTLSLAMAYDIEEKEAKTLTTAIVNFATGMGLGNEEMQRIIENFGQMKAAGKITGTELRDLSRGAFLPVNRVLQLMGENLGLDAMKIGELRTKLQGMTTEGEISIDEFFKAFIQMSNKDFPDAVDAMSSSWSVVRSNIDDFIETVIGWRIITPTLNIMSKRLSSFVSAFMQPKALEFSTKLGNVFAFLASKVFLLSDQFTGNIADGVTGFITPFSNLIDAAKEYMDITSKTNKSLTDQSKLLYRSKLTSSIRDILNIFGKGNLASKFTPLVQNLIDAVSGIGTVPVGDSIRSLMTSIGAIWDVAWTEILKPEIDKAWAKFKDWATDWWNDSIKPALEALWNKDIAPWLTTLWQKDIPEFFKNTAGPELAKAINGLAAWVLGTNIGKDVGSTITTAISGWLQSNTGQGSEFFGAVSSIMKSVFQFALSAGIEAIFGGAEAYATPKKKAGHHQADEVNNPQDYTVSPLTQAIMDLESATEKALNGSLAKLKKWVEETDTPFHNFYTTFKALELTVMLIGEPLKSIAGSFERINNAFGGGDKGGGSAKSDGVTDFIALFIQLRAKELDGIAKAFETIADAFEKIGSGPLTTVKGIFQMMTGNIGGGLKTVSEGVAKDIKTILSTDAGQYQILPDGTMQKLWDEITKKLGEIIAWIGPNFIDPFKEFFLPESFGLLGTGSMTGLFSAMKLVGEEISEWWAEFSNKFKIDVSVGVNYPGVTPGKPKPGENTGNGYGLAKGANFIVPPGYPNDSFQMRVQSGEHVIVIPKNVVLQSPKYKGVQGTSRIYGGMYNNSNTVVNKNYNLTVKSDVSPEMAVRQFGIMRLLDAE